MHTNNYTQCAEKTQTTYVYATQLLNLNNSMIEKSSSLFYLFAFSSVEIQLSYHETSVGQFLNTI